MFVQAVMTPEEALMTATKNPSQAYHLNNIGLIKIGADADLVLIDGDVLSNIRKLNNIEAVWKKGVLLDNNQGIR